MELQVLRIGHGSDSTVGILRKKEKDGWKTLAFTLEDEGRTKKVWGETRIPAGTYKLSCRKHGGFHTRYATKYKTWHKGMLQVDNVPGFTDILIHIGNTDDDTAGCLLVGNTANADASGNFTISASELAYKRIYPDIMDAVLNSNVTITYLDI